MNNLKLQIEERLWNFIKRSYNAENYSTAILDSIQFLGDVIREKAGLENDGNQLIGAAFGGENPKIKLNNFTTETEKNFQKGIENVLRGIYSAYRNPRSHTKVEDSESDAFEIITFINHLLKIIDKSTGRFTVEVFMRRIFDEDFFQTQKYADLLINDIPKGKYFEIAIEIFKSKEEGKIHNLKLIWTSVYAKLSEKQKAEILTLVSEELRFTESIGSIIKCIGLFKEYWEKIDEDARIRSENKLIKIIPKAELTPYDKLNESGIFCTWLTSIVKVSVLKYEIADKVFESLNSESQNKQRFIIEYFSKYFDYLEDELMFDSYKDILKRQLSKGSKVVYEFISNKYKGADKDEFTPFLSSFIQSHIVDDLPF